MRYTKDQLLARLQELKIDFTCYDHPAVLTVEAQANYVGHLRGGLSKNLLLKDKKHRLYIVSALAGTKVDLKVLSQRLGLGKGGLRMAPEDALQKVLQVPIGCVTPFALINESASVVSLLLDQGFKAQQCCFFHPLTNDVTIAINTSGLDKFLTSIGRHPSYVDLEASPVVGKDNPPDLAFLCPSETPTVLDSVDNVTPTHVPDENSAPKKPACATAEENNERPQITSSSSTIRKPESKADAAAQSTNVEKFVQDVIEMISPMLLSEVSKCLGIETKGLPESSIMDRVKRHITTDLESRAMILKNAAYTEGFHAGLGTVPYRRPS